MRAAPLETVADAITEAMPVTFEDVDPAIAKRLDAVILHLQRLEEERDQLILRAREEGASLREIAQHAGMTHVGIKKLIGRHLHADEIPEYPDEG